MFKKRIVNKGVTQLNQQDEREYISRLDPICSIERMCYEEGQAKGVSTFIANNAAGLSFSVLIDRGFDLGNVRYKGSIVNYISATGVTHPAYYNPEGLSWLRSFGGGLLTTCGYLQAGEPCEDDGDFLGLHGRISNLPAEQVCHSIEQEKDRIYGKMSGLVRESCHQRENLTRSRLISFEGRSNTIQIHDEIRNHASSSSPFMLVYHMNFGYPFLNQRSKLFLPRGGCDGWDDYSESMKSGLNQVPKPTPDAKDVLLIHDLDADANDNTSLLLVNEQYGVKISYNKRELPYLVQWQLSRSNDYVMALEPSNNHLRGRRWERENGTLRMIEPNEVKAVDLQISFLEPEDFAPDIRAMGNFINRGKT